MSEVRAFGRGRLLASWAARLKASRLLSEVVGISLLLSVLLLQRGSVERRLDRLATACRRVSSPTLRKGLARLLRPWQEGERARAWRAGRIGWGRYCREFDIQSPTLTTSLVLKGPGAGGEKGVLYCSFEYNWMRLVAHNKAERLLADYILIGASSWSPPDYAAMLNLAGLTRDPIFIGISHPSDLETYRVVAPTVRALPIMACDWINPAFYVPREPRARDIDILMVANFSLFKRHWLLFRALRRMRRDLRVTLIGIPVPGRGEEELRAEARAAGVRQDLEILTNVDIDTVTAFQCRARVSVILSQREGSCVAVTESLFAGSPVAMMRDAHIGARIYINAQTGVLLDEPTIARQLAQFVDASAQYRPCEWALERITCYHASARLNTILKEYSHAVGYPWVRDITALCWRYVPAYVESADRARMAAELERLRKDYGVELEEFRYRAA